MQNPTPQNTKAALRAAYGPGFQAGGPSEAALRIITKKSNR